MPSFSNNGRGTVPGTLKREAGVRGRTKGLVRQITKPRDHHPALLVPRGASQHHGAVMLWNPSSIGRASVHPIAAQAPCPRWSRLGPPSTGSGPRSIAAVSHRGRRSRSRHVSVQARSFTAGRETDEGSSSSLQRRQRTYDVVSLGNLCVDIVLPVASLPPPDHGQSACLTFPQAVLCFSLRPHMQHLCI